MNAITLNWLLFSFIFGALAYIMCRWIRPSAGRSGPPGDTARPKIPDDDRDSRLVPGRPSGRPAPTLDPVSGERLRMDQALAYFHRGKVYFFAGEETRARFAVAPRLYAPEMSDIASLLIDGCGPDSSPTTVSSKAVVTPGSHDGALPPQVRRL
jgi:YHS domain-containing protein